MPVLNYSKKITNGIEIFSYIHAYTKYTLPLNIAATGELGKQRLLEQSERLNSFWIFVFFFFFLPVNLKSKATN